MPGTSSGDTGSADRRSDAGDIPGEFASADHLSGGGDGQGQPGRGEPALVSPHPDRHVAVYGTGLYGARKGEVNELFTFSPEEMTAIDYLAGQRVRIALQGHAPFAAATQAVYETLKALREGTSPKNLTKPS